MNRYKRYFNTDQMCLALSTRGLYSVITQAFYELSVCTKQREFTHKIDF